MCQLDAPILAISAITRRLFYAQPAPDRHLVGGRPDSRQKFQHVERKRRDKFEPRARARMIDRERERMERLPSVKLLPRRLTRFFRTSIKPVAKTWMADTREVDSYLMGAPGLWPHPHEGRRLILVGEALQHRNVAYGFAGPA